MSSAETGRYPGHRLLLLLVCAAGLAFADNWDTRVLFIVLPAPRRSRTFPRPSHCSAGTAPCVRLH